MADYSLKINRVYPEDDAVDVELSHYVCREGHDQAGKLKLTLKQLRKICPTVDDEIDLDPMYLPEAGNKFTFEEKGLIELISHLNGSSKAISLTPRPSYNLQ